MVDGVTKQCMVVVCDDTNCLVCSSAAVCITCNDTFAVNSTTH